MNTLNVTLGGRQFPVPPLSISQLRTVVPNLVKLTAVAGGPNTNAFLDAENFGAMIDTVFVGVAAGSTGFTRKQFDDLPATPDELIAALNVISEQTGMRAEPGEAAVGEAPAVT